MKIKNTKKKRVLFVYRESFTDIPFLVKSTRYIINSLRKKYSLVTYQNLDSGVIELVRSNIQSHKFDALVTHVPYKSPSARNLGGLSFFLRERIELSESYQDSLLILRQIKLLTDIPIIAYTGAGDSPLIADIFWETGGVDRIMPKTIDSQKDSKEIINALDTLIQNYEKLPLSIPEPVIETEGNYTTAKVRVNLNGAVGFMSASVIAKECDRYKGRVLLKKLGNEDNGEPCDAKMTLDLLAFQILEGEEISILVEGLDEKAERLVKRLYYVLSCRYQFTMNLDSSEMKEGIKKRI